MKQGFALSFCKKIAINFKLMPLPEIYIQSAPNNSNETNTLGNTKTALKFKYEI